MPAFTRFAAGVNCGEAPTGSISVQNLTRPHMAQKRNEIRLYLQPTCSRQDARPNILRVLAGCNHARCVVKRIRKPASLLQLIGGADFDEHDVQHPQDHIVGDRLNIGQSSGFLFVRPVRFPAWEQRRPPSRKGRPLTRASLKEAPVCRCPVHWRRQQVRTAKIVRLVALMALADG